MNRVILIGRLTRDPEIMQTQSGLSVARFSVAVNRQFANKQTGEREADFIDCEAWRQTAEFVGKYFKKGSQICIEGELRNNNYTDKNGTKHYGMKVSVTQVHFTGNGNASQSQNGAANTQQARQSQQPAQNNAGLNLNEFEDILGGAPPF